MTAPAPAPVTRPNGWWAGSWRVPALGVPVADVALAVTLLGIALPGVLGQVRHPTVPAGVYPIVGLLVVAPLAVRRRWPVPVFAAVAGAAFAQWLLRIDVLVYDLAVLVALYTVAAYAGRRWSWPALAVTGLGGVLAWHRAPHNLAGIVPVLIVVAACWVLGDTLGTRRAYLAALEERAERLERERQATARAAAAEERTRIAREMHDVVAHRISVMVAQADGAAYALDSDVEQVRQALTVTASSGRAALAELRRLLGVLRTADSGTAPQPGADDVDALVEDYRAAGLPVRFVVEGPPAAEAAMGLTVYRLVQESLTNVLKHAGAGTPTQVRLRYRPDAVEVSVTDEGPERSPGAGGHGIIGMRERAAVFGGSLDAGPCPLGWRVKAWLPR